MGKDKEPKIKKLLLFLSEDAEEAKKNKSKLEIKLHDEDFGKEKEIFVYYDFIKDGEKRKVLQSIKVPIPEKNQVPNPEPDDLNAIVGQKEFVIDNTENDVTITLNGQDSEGEIVSYLWKSIVIEGQPTIPIVNNQEAVTYAIIPKGLEFTRIAFQLNVFDVLGNIDTEQIEVKPKIVEPPVIEVDKNGVLLLQLPNAKYDERSFDFVKNFRDDGSFRFDFEDKHRVDHILGGYWKVTQGPDDEDFSFLLKGGTSSDSHADDSRSYHLGINLKGNRIRLRKERKQGEYSENLIVKTLDKIDLRNRFVGLAAAAINVDEKGNFTDLENAKGVNIRLWIDESYDGVNPLQNKWVEIFNETDFGNLGFDGPYFDCYSGDKDFQVTMRIDGQTPESISWYGVYCSGLSPIEIPNPSPNIGEYDEFGTKIPFKRTGRYVDLTTGNDHENGQRFSENHKFENYIGIGYLLTGQGQELIENKHDGPNHSGRTDKNNPAHTWTEPAFHINNGQARIGSEHPHPTNHPEVIPEGAIKIGNLDKKWIGYGSYGYKSKDGFRVIGLLGTDNPFDGNGKPNNSWKLGCHVVDKGQICNIDGDNPDGPKRQIPPKGEPDGCEYEIRMHRATNHDTKIKWFRIYEIENPNTDEPPKL